MCRALLRGGAAATMLFAGNALATRWRSVGGALSKRWRNAGEAAAARWRRAGETLATRWQNACEALDFPTRQEGSGKLGLRVLF